MDVHPRVFIPAISKMFHSPAGRFAEIQSPCGGKSGTEKADRALASGTDMSGYLELKVTGAGDK